MIFDHDIHWSIYWRTYVPYLEHEECINSAATLDADRHTLPIGVPDQGISVTPRNQPDFRNTGFFFISFDSGLHIMCQMFINQP